MDFLSFVHTPIMSLLPSAASFLGYALSFLIALSIIVFIHEYGHFKTARVFGTKVETFAIGFGKEIFGFYDRYGTRWKIGWMPLGGYVKFLGDANAASLPDRKAGAGNGSPDEFHNKPVWQRALVVAAGPIANFLLAIFIFTMTNMFVGVPVSEPRVFEVIPGSAAEEAGFKPGDTIKSINGSAISSFADLQDIVRTRGGDTLTIVFDRDGTQMAVNATPKVSEDKDQFGNQIRYGLLGIKQDPNAMAVLESQGPVDAFVGGVNRTWSIIEMTLRYVGKIIIGQESTNQLGGIGSIAQAAGNAASLGLVSYLAIIGFLSVSIGLINLFPIPMLDGGHLVYYAIEAVRGKPLGPNAQEWGFRIGFAFVMGLMLLGNWNDVVRLLINRG